MSLYLGVIAFALFSWWFSTGLVLFLNHLAIRSYRWSLAVISAVSVGSLATLQVTAAMTDVPGVLLAFTQGLLIWAWLELTYFMGFLTGPRNSPCPESVQGWQRFRLALLTSAYHELAVVVVGIAVLTLTWGAPNPVAAATYIVLWTMRWSAKLNLFLGVANVNSEWFPQPLQYLVSYIRRRPMNGFFPVIITLATAMLALLTDAALQAQTPFAQAALTITAALLALAILEHWFLVLPLRDSVLWQWSMDLAKRVTRPRRGRSIRRSVVDDAPGTRLAGPVIVRPRPAAGRQAAS
jgi:putative photosynthetic complex assembly protein 2